VTDPEATDADRQEQQQLATPPVPELAEEVTPFPDHVPEADGIEQQLSAVPGSTGGPRGGVVEADEYDLLEQQAVVPADEDDVRD
jgi:hypothetical protein